MGPGSWQHRGRSAAEGGGGGPCREDPSISEPTPQAHTGTKCPFHSDGIVDGDKSYFTHFPGGKKCLAEVDGYRVSCFKEKDGTASAIIVASS